jgi:hypothetical protein
VQAIAALVTATATVWYAFLTRKLWVATNANVMLTKQMVERSEEPLCCISGLVQSLKADGTLTIEFEAKNAGRSILNNVSVVSEWKGFDHEFPDRPTFGSDWIGVLLPGESSSRLRYSKPLARPKDLPDRALHLALFLQYQGPAPMTFAHIWLASVDLVRGFYVRKSLIVKEGDEYFAKSYHLLDDVSSVIRRSGAPS